MTVPAIILRGEPSAESSIARRPFLSAMLHSGTTYDPNGAPRPQPSEWRLY